MGQSMRSNGPAGQPHGFADRVRQIGDDAQILSAAVRDAAADLESYLTEHVRRSPARTLAVAAGVGYVLGGGLRSRLNSLLLGVGARLAMAVAARQLGARIGLVQDTPAAGAAPTKSERES